VEKFFFFASVFAPSRWHEFHQEAVSQRGMIFQHFLPKARQPASACRTGVAGSSPWARGEAISGRTHRGGTVFDGRRPGATNRLIPRGGGQAVSRWECRCSACRPDLSPLSWKGFIMMTKLKQTALTIAVAAICSPVCLAQNQPGANEPGQNQNMNEPGQNPAGQNHATPGAQPGQMAQQAGAMEQPNAQEQAKHFFTEAASGNAFEIKLAQLAQERSNDPQVKQIAKTLQQDHQQAQDNLQKIAQQQGVQVSTDQLNPVHQAMYDMMQKKQGDQFTRAFLFGLTGIHQTDVLMYSYEANKAQNPGVKQYASETLPTLQKHLTSLEQLARPMAGEMAQNPNEPGQAQPAGSRLPAEGGGNAPQR
jgi:putative membrane protein